MSHTPAPGGALANGALALLLWLLITVLTLVLVIIIILLLHGQDGGFVLACMSQAVHLCLLAGQGQVKQARTISVGNATSVRASMPCCMGPTTGSPSLSASSSLRSSSSS